MRLSRPRVTAVSALLLLVSGLLVAVVSASGSTATAAVTVPRYDHIVVAIFENHSVSQINSGAPYFKSLADQGAEMTKSFGVTHPSQPNYLALFSGSTQGNTDDSCPHTYSTGNLGQQLVAAGLTYKAYSEGLPSAGSTVCTYSTGKYARKHAPWVNFSNLSQSLHRPFSEFPTSDFASLPTVSFVVPNLCNDMHDCSVSTGSTWLQSHLDAYAQWAKTHNSLLITTFDEDNNTSVNQIYTSLVGAHVTAGDYSQSVNHYNVLRTIEDAYGLTPLGNAGSKSAITGIWN